MKQTKHNNEVQSVEHGIFETLETTEASGFGTFLLNSHVTAGKWFLKSKVSLVTGLKGSLKRCCNGVKGSRNLSSWHARRSTR